MCGQSSRYMARHTDRARATVYRGAERIYVELLTRRWLLPLRTLLGAVLLVVQTVRLSLMDRTVTLIRPYGDDWAVHDLRRHDTMYSPALLDTYHITRAHRAALRDAYTRPGFVTVEADDTVFDVGAYLGAFSLAVAGDAAQVYSVEPSPEARRSLERNTADHDHITLIGTAAWHRQDRVALNRSLLPNENSLLDVDAGDSGSAIEVEADTLASLADRHGVDTIDYLKVEAEGAEPEVLRGILGSDVTVRKIVVDCSPERGSGSPADTVRALLDDAGYRCETGYGNPWNVPFIYARRDAAP